jgi:hypothetical protein
MLVQNTSVPNPNFTAPIQLVTLIPSEINAHCNVPSKNCCNNRYTILALHFHTLEFNARLQFSGIRTAPNAEGEFIPKMATTMSAETLDNLPHGSSSKIKVAHEKHTFNIFPQYKLKCLSPFPKAP